ncbi:MAG: hypothetical protein ABSB63_19025 [Spirochaetia bacterium]
MSGSAMVRAAALVLLCAAARGLAAQEAAPRTLLFFGPRLGISAVVQEPSEFNDNVQSLLHDSSRDYFPVYSEMGIQAQQLFPLGGTRSYLTFQQTLLLGGLDQGMPLPSAYMTLGYRLPFGLALGLGPYITVAAPDGAPRFALALVYEVGWNFSLPGFTIPLTFIFVPLPSYVNPHISLLCGLSFGTLE